MGEVLPLDVTPPGAGRFGFTAGALWRGRRGDAVQRPRQSLDPEGGAGAGGRQRGGGEALAARHRGRAADRRGGEDGGRSRRTLQRGAGRARHREAAPPIRWSPSSPSPAAPPPGNELARAAGAKKFVGELGSNAANIVCADADLADAATRIAGAAFEASGQQCISAQRVIVERPVFDRFLELFVAAARKLKVGDPEDAAPMSDRW